MVEVNDALKRQISCSTKVRRNHRKQGNLDIWFENDTQKWEADIFKWTAKRK